MLKCLREGNFVRRSCWSSPTPASQKIWSKPANLDQPTNQSINHHSSASAPLMPMIKTLWIKAAGDSTMKCNVCYKHEKHVIGHSTSSLRKWFCCSDSEETSQQCRRITISLFYRSCWDMIQMPQVHSLYQFQSKEEQILESGHNPKKRKLKRVNLHTWRYWSWEKLEGK